MGDKTQYWLTGFAATMVAGLSITGVMCEQTLPYYLAVGLTAAHLGQQVGSRTSKGDYLYFGYHPRKRTLKKHPKHVFSKYENTP